MVSTIERFHCISAVLNCFHKKLLTSHLETVVIGRRIIGLCAFVVVTFTVHVGMLALLFLGGQQNWLKCGTRA